MHKLPAPVAASRPSPSPVNLNRALVVQGLPGDTTLHSILLNVNQGALEFARIEDEPSEFAFLPPAKALTLSFLASSSAQAFVDTHLAEPVRLHAFTHSLFPSWHWLPPTPLPASISEAVRSSIARRVLAISWRDSRQDFMFSHDLGQFGPLERFWRFNPRLLVVSFFAIADAIKAKAHIPRNPAPGTWLSVGYFADWCELSEEARSHLMRKSRRETYRAYHPSKTSTSNAPNARKGKRTTPSKSTPNGEPETTPATTVSPTNPVMERYKAALDSMDVTAFQASPPVLMMRKDPHPHIKKTLLTAEVADGLSLPPKKVSRRGRRTPPRGRASKSVRNQGTARMPTKTLAGLVTARIGAVLHSMLRTRTEMRKARRKFQQQHADVYATAADGPKNLREHATGRKPETRKPPRTTTTTSPVSNASGNATTTDG